jgi:hypothetical protein
MPADRHFTQAGLNTLNALAKHCGMDETREQTFDRHMESPLSTYMGGGWFSCTSRVDPGDTSRWRPPETESDK